MAISGHSMSRESCVIQQKTVTGALDGMLRHFSSLYEHSKSVTLELFCQPEESR